MSTKNVTIEQSFVDDDGTTHKWAVTKFTGREGVRIFATLMQFVAPALTEMIDDVDTDGTKAKVKLSGDAIGGAVQTLVSKLDEDTVIILIERLLAETRKDGNEVLPIFDTEFMGEYGKLFKILTLVIKHNYSDFFDVLSSDSKTVTKEAVLEIVAVKNEITGNSSNASARN